MKNKEFQLLEHEDAPLATPQDLARVHHLTYVESCLGAIPERGLRALDPDTIVSPGSGQAALRAAGALLAGVDAVATGQALNAFAAVRPPGHHATPDRAMGFCLFNNVAIGAAYARARYGFSRLAIVDFDVHHGNGTQAIFEADPDTFYASTHQENIFPGTGRRDERGVGNLCNVPLPAGAGGEAFREAMENAVLPALAAFEPDFLFISAGFDAHRGDPLAGLRLETEDYAWVTTKLLEIADATCGGRVVSALEGGYAPDDLAASAAAHVRALMGGRPALGLPVERPGGA